MTDKYAMLAKTFQGLETVLADELRELGAENVEIGRRMVSFEGDKMMMYKANFCLRTALRILKPIYTFTATDAEELYEAAKHFEWDKVVALDQTFSIDSTVYSDEFKHSKFVTYRVKDAIVDWFNDKYEKRPSVRLTNADIMFNVHIAGDQVTISLDSSGESLHKRGYRVAQTEAPINEVLAAGLIKLTGWDGKCNLVDPMCGSGTFLIEAALIGANIYPGVYRDGFAFERWRDFEPEMFDEIYNDDSKERDFDFKIYGSDISPKAIDIANKNIKNAAVGKYIETEVKPLQSYESAPENAILISNPPYGERISVEDMEGFYKLIGDKLKNVFKGYEAWLIGPDNEIFGGIGLKPSIKYPILNGSLECEFREYVIFEGKYNDLRKEGGHVKNEKFKHPEGVAKRYQGQGDRKFKDERKPYGKRDDRDGDRKPYDRDRKPFDRERKPFDRDRKPYGKREERDGDRKPFDRDRKPFDRDSKPYERREDRDGERRPRPYGKRPEPDAPRNALEERYRKPFAGRNNDRPRGERPERDDRERRPFNPSGEKLHGEEAVNSFKFREPTLGKEAERPIFRGRRNGWKRAEADKDNKKENND